MITVVETIVKIEFNQISDHHSFLRRYPSWDDYIATVKSNKDVKDLRYDNTHLSGVTETDGIKRRILSSVVEQEEDNESDS